MSTILLTVGFFGICMGGMAIGAIVAGKRLHGSCGGPNSDDCLCEIEKRRACAARERMMARLVELRQERETAPCTD